MNDNIIYNIIEPNGKTIKENNTAIEHNFLIGALVEINESHESEYNGLRLFVVHCSRDCDGEILYDLSFNRHAQIKYEEAKLHVDSNNSTLNIAIMNLHSGSILRHFSEASLTLIKTPDGKDVNAI